MPIPKPPCGWGSLTPDKTLLPETAEVIKRLGNLPAGQRDLLLTYAVARELSSSPGTPCDWLKVEASDMVLATHHLFNIHYDIIHGVEAERV